MSKVLTKRELRARRVERLKRQCDAQLAEERLKAVDAVGNMLQDATPWAERTVAHTTALKMVEWHEAENRAKKQGQVTNNNFGVVYLPQPPQSGDEWEKRVAARREAALEAELAPLALPPKDPEAA